jgi:TRAP-type mannitol/chloroaromatic compound transport system substrate-binding protein
MNPRQFKRRQVLKAAGLGVVASAVAKPAIAQANPAIKWRLTLSFTKSLETVYSDAGTIARFVEESTDNQFQMQNFAGGEIVPSMDAVG